MKVTSLNGGNFLAGSWVFVRINETSADWVKRNTVIMFEESPTTRLQG